MKKQYRFSMWYAVLGVWLVLLLHNLINEVALLVVRRDKKRIGMAEIEEVVERVVAGLEKKNRLINPAEKEIVAYHELGHAIVAMALPGVDPV